jgi:L-fuculose-phosphate aldolase
MNVNGTLLNEWKYREQMCEIGRRVYNKGFAAANDGNISLRLDENRVLCTPTRVSKGYMKPDDLCIVDLNGKQLSGKKKRSSEILLHLTIMKARADVRSVVHCHPPHATAFAVAREPIPKCVLPEIEVFLGEVAISPYETPGSQSFADTVLPYVKDTDTILLANHGTVTYGSDLEDAYFKTEIIDAYCRILLLARQLGRVHYYSDEKAAELIRLKPGMGIPDPRLERGLENCDLCGNSLFRRGYGEGSPEPHVFLHPKLADDAPEALAIESCWTPLASELKQAQGGAASQASAPHAAPGAGSPSSNGSVPDAGLDQEALVQAITNQVMQVLNGMIK